MKKRRVNFSNILEEKRTRIDITAELLKFKKEKTVTQAVFSSAMIKKYTYLYIFCIFFTEKKQLAWKDLVLKLIGWDPNSTNSKIEKRQFQMILHRALKSLYQDFNVKIEAIKASKEQYQTIKQGLSYYQIVDYGLFDKEKLLYMLKTNELLFLNIISTKNLK